MYGATLKLSVMGAPFTMNFWTGDCWSTTAQAVTTQHAPPPDATPALAPPIRHAP